MFSLVQVKGKIVDRVEKFAIPLSTKDHSLQSLDHARSVTLSKWEAFIYVCLSG